MVKRSSGDYIFLMCHVPRTEGTAICRLFIKIFGIENCRIQDTQGSKRFLSKFKQDVAKGIRFFSGHLPIEDFFVLKRAHPEYNIEIILTIRHPISHFYSLFLHNRILDIPLERRIDPVGLRRFLRDFDPGVDFDASTVNVLCRYLCGRLTGELGLAEYRVARRSLSRVDFVFDCDRLEVSVGEFMKKYRITTSSRAALLNVDGYSRFTLERDTPQLLHLITRLIRFDLSLYGPATRWMYKANKSSYERQISTPPRTPHLLYLSEAIRRSPHRVEAEAGLFEFRRHDLFLHPPREGATRIYASEVARSSPGAVLHYTAALAQESVGEVLFRVRVLDGVTSVVSETTLAPGERRDVRLSLYDLHGSLSIELSTEMSNDAVSNDFAWAILQAPCIEYRSDPREQRKDVLARHRFHGDLPDLEAERDVRRPRALFIDDLVPEPDKDAGSNAAFQHMLSLRRLSYEVTFVPSGNKAKIDLYTDELQRGGIECLDRPYYFSVEDVLRKQEIPFELVYLHRYSNASKYAGMIRQNFPDARILYCVADLHFLRMQRQAEVENNPGLREEADQQRRRELGAMSFVDCVIVHSVVEAELLRQIAPDVEVQVIPWTIPLREITKKTGQQPEIAFVGGYRHLPNVDAAKWAAQSIMPALRGKVPGIELLLVGSNMPEEVSALAAKDIVPLGYVPSLDSVFARIRLTIAPLRYGAGLKGKVLESLAAGVPCVMTTVAAEGLDLPAELQSLVADEPEALSDRIATLCQDCAEYRRIVEAGKAYIAANYSSDRIDAMLWKACGAE